MKPLLFVLVLSWGAYAQAPQYGLEGRVTYSASYAWGRWEGSNPSLAGTVTWNPGSGEIGGKVCVDLTRFDSGNPLRDADGRGVFEVNRYPQSCLIPTKLTVQGENALLVGSLDLHGVQREIRVSGTLTKDGTTYAFRGGFSTRFSEWNLNRPMLIFVTVDDPVQVSVEVRVVAR